MCPRRAGLGRSLGVFGSYEWPQGVPASETVLGGSTAVCARGAVCVCWEGLQVRHQDDIGCPVCSVTVCIECCVWVLCKGRIGPPVPLSLSLDRLLCP